MAEFCALAPAEVAAGLPSEPRLLQHGRGDRRVLRGHVLQRAIDGALKTIGQCQKIIIILRQYCFVWAAASAVGRGTSKGHDWAAMCYNLRVWMMLQKPYVSAQRGPNKH